MAVKVKTWLHRPLLLFTLLLVSWSVFADEDLRESVPSQLEETQSGRETVEYKVFSLPKYEWGVGGGTFLIPDYPGAEQSRQRALFLPYFVYRGDALKVDRNGKLRTNFFESDQYDVDMSLSGAFASNSEDNDARQGMEDLDWMLEVGPRLVIHLLPSKTSFKATLDLNLPVRWVVSTDFGRVDHRGFAFAPNLIYRRPNTFVQQLTFIASGTMNYGTEALMDYFYEVPEEFATPSRRVYNAEGGYMNTSVLLGLGYRYDSDVLVFFGAQAAYYDGATNQNSPLLKSIWNYSYGVGLAWKLYESEEQSTMTFDPEDY